MIEDPSQPGADDAAQARSVGLTLSPQQLHRRIALRGPLSNATRTEAKILIFLGALAVAVKIPGGMSVVAVLTGAVNLAPQTLPLTLMAAVFYFASLVLIHTIAETIMWWPEWRSVRRVDHSFSAGIITAIAVVRLLLECVLPLVLGVLALR